MPEPRWERIKAVFAAASAKTGRERSELLDHECAGDVELRRQVEALLHTTSDEAPPSQRASQSDPQAGPVAHVSHKSAVKPTTATAPISERPGNRIGKYKLLERIGEGGFGEVWVAEQDKPVRRKVALKIVKAGMDTREVLARFEAERQALAVMDHPNVARVFDAGATESGRPYFVMEHVQGVPITTYCDSARLKIKDRLGLFIDICQAVQHAHQKGIIHRDIKPSNILVTLHDGKPIPKVIDFGIAKAAIGRLTERTLYTEQGRLIGTPEYMSPEQAGVTGLDVDTRADVYSLGVLLYQLLTGTLPFDAAMLREAGYDGIARIIKEQEPPKPSTRVVTLATEKVNRVGGITPETISRSHDTDIRSLTKELRGDLDWIVMKSMEKDRTRRYETANAFAADVRRHLSGEPVVAAPPSAAYRVRKFMRKHRGQVIAASVIAATLLIASVMSTLAWRAQRHARMDADFERTRADTERDGAQAEAYAASLSAAQREMSFFQYPEARARLEGCLERKRGWEWRFLQQQAAGLQIVLRDLSTAVFSRDGTRILTAGNDNTARVFDAVTGKQVGKGMKHEHRLQSAVFSPDGTRVLTTSTNDLGPDNAARLWDSASGEQVATTMKDGLLMSADFSHDGTQVLTASMNGVKLWDLSGSRTGAIGRVEPVSVASFSPDDKLVVTTSGEGIARLWDHLGGQLSEMRAEHEGDSTSNHRAVFSPNGKSVLTFGWDRTSRVWDLSGRQVGETMRHSQPLGVATFSPDGTRILTTSYGDVTKMWDASTGKQIGELGAAAYAAAFDHSGTRVLTMSTDNTAKLWNLEGRCLGVIDLPRAGDSVANCSFSEDGRLALFADGSSWAIVVPVARFDSPEQRIHKELEIEEIALFGEAAAVGIAASKALSPDGMREVMLDENAVRFRDTASGREIASIRLPMSGVDLRFTPDGTRLFIKLRDKTALVWDARSPATRQADRDARAVERSLAKSYVDTLLSGSDPNDRLATAIRENNALPPVRRAEALDVLRESVTRIDAEAQRAFESIKNERVLTSAVRTEAAARAGLAPRVKAALLKMAQEWNADASILNEFAWRVVSKSDSPSERVAAALEAANDAARQEPNNGFILNTLGVALYRSGKFNDAIATLMRSSELNLQQQGREFAADVAFIAMAEMRLGRGDDARASLSRLHELMKQKGDANVGESQGFLREAEELIEGRATTPASASQPTSQSSNSEVPQSLTVTTQPSTRTPIDETRKGTQ